MNAIPGAIRPPGYVRQAVLAGSGTPSAQIAFTQRGKTVYQETMKQAMTNSGQPYFYVDSTIKDAGTFVAHMTVRLGGSSQSHDVPFAVTR